MNNLIIFKEEQSWEDCKESCSNSYGSYNDSSYGNNMFPANWGSYFGANADWYEGAEGKLTANTAAGFTASINSVGWGGVWGAQYISMALRMTMQRMLRLQKENLTHFHLTSALQTYKVCLC